MDFVLAIEAKLKLVCNELQLLERFTPTRNCIALRRTFCEISCCLGNSTGLGRFLSEHITTPLWLLLILFLGRWLGRWFSLRLLLDCLAFFWLLLLLNWCLLLFLFSNFRVLLFTLSLLLSWFLLLFGFFLSWSTSLLLCWFWLFRLLISKWTEPRCSHISERIEAASTCLLFFLGLWLLRSLWL